MNLLQMDIFILRVYSCENVLKLIFFYLAICMKSVQCSNINDFLPILDIKQTHYIPIGSYFQYTFTNMNLQQSQYNQSISEFNISITLSFDFQPSTSQSKNELLSSSTSELLTSQPSYDIFIFPQRNEDSEELFENYAKAIDQGLTGLMPTFSQNYSEPATNCQDCYQHALYTNSLVACLNCSQTLITVNLTSERWVELSIWNNTIMTIVDNSIGQATSTQIQPEATNIQLTMQYAVCITYDEEYQALFILFFAVISSLIIILTVLAVCLTLKIKKVHEEILECKQKIKTQ